MKRLYLTIVLLALSIMLFAAEPVSKLDNAVSENTLSTAAGYLDSMISSVLLDLELVASTPEAKQGDWKGIKPYLMKIDEEYPGVFFYVMPDGNYYSVTMDYTNLNLTNRGYFKALFSGKTIKGYPVYSRSSNKKSGVVAAPIMVDGKVSGALGASVFLDELHSRLNQDMQLPANFTWFVVDTDGTVLLDHDADFIMMNALTGGSASLKAEIGKCLQSTSGKISYENNGIYRHGFYQKLPNLPWRMILVKTDDGPIQISKQQMTSLELIIPGLQKSLSKTDQNIAKNLAATQFEGRNDKQIRGLLTAILEQDPMIVNACYVDTKSVLALAEPSEYQNVEGTDISKQSHVMQMAKDKKPLLSSGFETAEGFYAVVDVHPMFDKKNSFLGSISMVIRPERMVTTLLKNLEIPDNYELWMMQTDGMIVYDQNPEEIGLMLFDDEIYAQYPSLVELGRKMVATPSGKGEYIFLDPQMKDSVIKTVVWDTVKLHDRQWRVVLAHRPYQN
ncbi:MAG: cache domain-containing protein [Candidatus Cloacimonetes bacterium]|nr:cache domain-containing protein [Candidatus Cloacimonadota bacterium]MCK9184705.1 cache domain-containing protein [Candidatus Cloacimonadota bacterium]